MIRTCLTVLSVFLALSISGQKLILDLYSYPTIDREFSPSVIVPYGGLGLSLRHGKNQRFESGLSFRSVPWGAELSLSERFIFVNIDKEKYAFGNSSKVFLGLPLFYNKLSISTAISSESMLKVNFSKDY